MDKPQVTPEKAIKTTASVSTLLKWCKQINNKSSKCGKEADLKTASVIPAVQGKASYATSYRKTKRSRRNSEDDVVVLDIEIKTVVNKDVDEDQFLSDLKTTLNNNINDNENLSGVLEISPIESEDIPEDIEIPENDAELAPMDYLTGYVANVGQISENFQVVKFGELLQSWSA